MPDASLTSSDPAAQASITAPTAVPPSITKPDVKPVAKVPAKPPVRPPNDPLSKFRDQHHDDEARMGFIDHLMELRRIIEPSAAELAARRGTAEDHAAIGKAYEAMVAAGNDVPAFVAADVRFHVACLSAARNEFLLPVTHAIRASLVASMRITNRDSEQNRTVTLPLHKAIYDAILARDTASARQAMQAHLDDTERRRTAMLAQKPGRKAAKR